MAMFFFVRVTENERSLCLCSSVLFGLIYYIVDDDHQQCPTFVLVMPSHQLEAFKQTKFDIALGDLFLNFLL